MVRKCEVCGDEFETGSKRKKMCPVCDAVMSYKSPFASAKKKKEPKEDLLDKLLGEIAKYNRENGTDLSYGQYVAMFNK